MIAIRNQIVNTTIQQVIFSLINTNKSSSYYVMLKANGEQLREVPSLFHQHKGSINCQYNNLCLKIC